MDFAAISDRRARLVRSIIVVITSLISLLGAGYFFVSAQFTDLATTLAAWPWLNIGVEQSFAMWWTSAMWTGLALLFIDAGLRDEGRSAVCWYALAIGAAMLSLDESVMIHEQFGGLSISLFGSGQGVWATNWVVLAVPIVLLCLAALAPFLWRLPRRLALGLALSGTVFVAGAVGLEMAFGLARVDYNLDGKHVVILTMHWLEETLEMAGVALACIVMLGHLRTTSR